MDEQVTVYNVVENGYYDIFVVLSRFSLNNR